MARKRTHFQALKQRIKKKANQSLWFNWEDNYQRYLIDFRTIGFLDHQLNSLVLAEKIECENTYNRGGRKQRDYINARTITTWRLVDNPSCAFQIIVYHRSSPHELHVVGNLPTFWHVWRKTDLGRRLYTLGNRLVWDPEAGD